jgi:hypothetical protein
MSGRGTKLFMPLALIRAVFALTLAAALSSAANAATLACRQPQLAAAGDVVYIACGNGSTISVAKSEDGGRSFGPLTTIATVGALSLGNHRGPRVAVAGDAVIVTAIAGTVGGGKDGDLMAWRSTDGGRTWSPAVKVNDVDGAAREGLHAMAALGSTVVTAWLDLRARGTQLYASISSDAGRTWSRNILVYESPSGTICQCCHPSLAITEAGEILVMFRNALDGHRDFYLARGKTGAFGPPQKLGTGSCTLDACPMDGGGVGTSGGDVTTVWRREQTVYLASPGQPESVIGDGVNPALAISARGPVVAWNASKGLMVTAAGHEPRLLDAAGKFVALAPTAYGVLAAWETGDGAATRLIDADLR